MLKASKGLISHLFSFKVLLIWLQNFACESSRNGML